jgi:hypothetical protein
VLKFHFKKTLTLNFRVWMAWSKHGFRPIRARVIYMLFYKTNYQLYNQPSNYQPSYQPSIQPITNHSTNHLTNHLSSQLPTLQPTSKLPTNYPTNFKRLLIKGLRSKRRKVFFRFLHAGREPLLIPNVIYTHRCGHWIPKIKIVAM